MAHNYTRMFFHFIWGTWDRTPLLVGEIEETAYAVICSQSTEMGGKVFAIGGIENHVHLLVSLPTTVSVADFIKSVKGVSSRTLNQDYGCPAWNFKWQGRYGAITVCPSHVSLIRGYVEKQKQHHIKGSLWDSCEKIAEDD